MTPEAKKYIRIILEYSEFFDGAQEKIDEEFGGPGIETEEEQVKYDEWYEKTISPLQAEIRAFLYGENK